ncbi:flagellar motor protein MotB [Shimia marina]|uniref:Chemotaxis protein MotB n=1 Tax=Shimia marina TaxID=321267 RepID=A0A0P1FAH2_9RHOB|nr:flagellar motor protein MotB [Shimia marina]CUH51653.1 Chemotaxis protein MotB [Shimia marina]SFD43810.1 chemotaxis protein MotB [Shimia marina]
MADNSNAPVIIKRKKVVGGDGHHGGAWKIAYADFVTAMMAFFLLMWLINATTEQQRLGIAEFFNPSVPLNKISGGGSAMFGGDNVLEERILAYSGTGGLPTSLKGQPEAVEFQQPGSGQEDGLKEVQDLLIGGGGESLLSDNMLKHVVTRVTDEGLVIEIFDADNARLFVQGTSEPMPLLLDIAEVLSEVSGLVSNNVAVEGHVRSELITVRETQAWPLSSNRANAMRELLTIFGLEENRIARVTGHADREMVSNIPRDLRNNRIEIILLRSDQ